MIRQDRTNIQALYNPDKDIFTTTHTAPFTSDPALSPHFQASVPYDVTGSLTCNLGIPSLGANNNFSLGS